MLLTAWAYRYPYLSVSLFNQKRAICVKAFSHDYFSDITRMKSYPIYIKGAYFFIFLFCLLYGISYAKSLLAPICISGLVSILFMPLADKMERKGVHRLLSSVLCTLMLLLFFALVIYLFSRQISVFTSNLPALRSRLLERLNDIQKFVEQETNLPPNKQIEWLRNQVALVPGVALVTAGSLFVMLPVPFYMFFLLFYRDKFKTFLLNISQEQNYYMVEQITTEVKAVVQNYLWGILIVIAIVTGMLWGGLAAAGVPYALFLGAVGGVLNVIPYLGIASSALLTMAITFLTTSSNVQVLEILGVYLGTHLLESNIITPNIVGSKVSVNPLATIIALILGEMIWGIMGMILFIPLTGVLKVYFDHTDSMKPYGFLMGTEGTEEHSISFGGTWRHIRRMFTGKRKIRKEAEKEDLRKQ